MKICNLKILLQADDGLLFTTPFAGVQFTRKAGVCVGCGAECFGNVFFWNEHLTEEIMHIFLFFMNTHF